MFFSTRPCLTLSCYVVWLRCVTGEPRSESAGGKLHETTDFFLTRRERRRYKTNEQSYIPIGAAYRVKKSNTKELIIETATNLFYEQGFGSSSIRDIVRAVGVTNSTVYIHFKDKDEILYKIVNEIGVTLINVLQEATRGVEDPVERLKKMIFAQVCLVKEKRKEIKIYMEEQFQLPRPLRKEVLKQHRYIYNLYYDAIAEIKAAGLLRDIDQAVVTFGISAMMNWSYRWYDERGRLSIEQIAQDIIRTFFFGILKEGPYSEKDYR